MMELSTIGKNIAFVLEPNSVKDPNHIKVYIPKFMSNIDMGDNIYEKPLKISSKCIKNANFTLDFKKEITERNFINVTSLNNFGQEPNLLNKGQVVNIEFIDGDLARGKYTLNEVDNTNKNIPNQRLRFFIDSEEIDNEEKNNKTSSSIFNIHKTIFGDEKRTEIYRQNEINSSSKTKEGYTFYDFLMDSIKKYIALRIKTKNTNDDNNEDDDGLLSLFLKEENEEIILRNSHSMLRFLIENKDMEGELDKMIFKDSYGSFALINGELYLNYDDELEDPYNMKSLNSEFKELKEKVSSLEGIINELKDEIASLKS